MHLEHLEDRLVPSASSVDIAQYKDNPAQNAVYSNESTLTPQNVSSSAFGKIASDPVDGQIFAQPLYLRAVNVNSQTQNLVIVATENDSVYAFNADTGVEVWQDNFTNPSQGITAIPDQNLNQTDISPIVGITATPVYDPSTGTLYVEDRTVQQTNSSAAPVYSQQLFALNIANGQEVDGGPVTIGTTTMNSDGTFTNNTNVSVSGTGTDAVNGQVYFNAMTENDRAALVLDTNVPGNPDGVIYMGFASLGDLGPYHGWFLGYDAKTLQLYSVFNTTPDADHGAIWSSGGGPSIDAQGNLYVSVGDGPFSAFTSNTAPGANALGDEARGLGYGGLSNSLAVEFNADDPVGHSSTGLLYNGVYPSYAPTAPNQFVSLDSTGIDFGSGASNMPVDTYQATLSYNGSNLVETIVDQTSGATFTHTYTNVNLTQTVGGSTAYVGFTAGTSGDPTEQDILNWTYSTNNSTVIDHSRGFSSNGDLTANGSAQFTSSSSSNGNNSVSNQVAQLTDMGKDSLDEAGSIFANTPVNISNFTTTFTFQMAGNQTPIGEGLTFTIQNAQGNQSQPNYGETLLKLSPNAGNNHVLDSFTPDDTERLSISDLDLGSGSPLLLSFPGTAVPNEVIISGKGGTLYLLNADNLGGFNSGSNNVIQELTLGEPHTNGTWGTPVVFNNTLYIQEKNEPLSAYQFVLDSSTNTMMLNPTPISQTSQATQFPNMNPAVSANGTSNGIVWGIQSDDYQSGGPEILHAYNPNNLTDELFNSSMDSANQTDGPAVKFAVPTVAKGRVYVGAGDALDVYGLLSSSTTGGGGSNSGQGGNSSGNNNNNNGSSTPPSLFQALIDLYFDGFKLAADFSNPTFSIFLGTPQSIFADIDANQPYAGEFGFLAELLGIEAFLNLQSGNSSMSFSHSSMTSSGS